MGTGQKKNRGEKNASQYLPSVPLVEGEGAREESPEPLTVVRSTEVSAVDSTSQVDRRSVNNMTSKKCTYMMVKTPTVVDDTHHGGEKPADG